MDKSSVQPRRECNFQEIRDSHSEWRSKLNAASIMKFHRISPAMNIFQSNVTALGKMNNIE